MNSILSLLVAAAGFTADRLTKNRMKDDTRVRKIAGGHIIINKSENRGFAMNKFENNRKLVVGISAAVFAICTVIYAIILIKPAYKCLRLGFGLIMGGAAGNAYDRLVHGRVVDFFSFSFLKRVVFNLADVFLITGSLLAILGDLLSQ